MEGEDPNAVEDDEPQQQPGVHARGLCVLEVAVFGSEVCRWNTGQQQPSGAVMHEHMGMLGL